MKKLMYKIQISLLMAASLILLSCTQTDDILVSVKAGSDEVKNACTSEVGCNAITASKRTLQNLSGFSHSDTNINSVTSDNDDNFYFAGRINSDSGNGEDAYIAKFDTSTESIDTSFGTNGVTIISTANIEYFASISLSLDKASIYGIGREKQAKADALIAKFNLTTGALDSTFSGDGKIVEAYPGNHHDSGFSVSEFKDGSVYSCGYAYNNGTTWYDSVISKYSSTGVLDTNFGTNGHLLYNLGNNNYFESCYKVIELSNGQILMYGLFADANGDDHKPFFRKFNADWTLDTNFGTDGTFKMSLASYRFQAADRDLFLDGDDLYIIGRSQETSGGLYRATILKVDISSGVLDSSFGENGELIATPLCASGDQSQFTGAIMLKDTFLIRGRCFDSGTKDVGFISAIKKDGSLDSKFNNGNAYFNLGDTSVDQRIISRHMKIGTKSIKVYTVDAGKIDIYDLSW